ncbi:hypothetical protein RDV89_09130 [Nocardioides zeae]|uniref:Uncharacterized protein n=1 Tax=Nocardioides imazamoxiresistens TaxID=3231893 RepID=A0ABU3PVG6_9ACTN|nr:hypothetical protein [Nocardioides zeae]MDT9593230.1 hypothetical protein [Nocardioides zeae]
MNDARRAGRAARGGAGLAALALASGAAIALPAAASAAAPSASATSGSMTTQVPTTDCPGDYVQQVQEVPDVVAGTVVAVEETTGPEPDVPAYQVALRDVRPLTGDVEATADLAVLAVGQPGADAIVPVAEEGYVVFVTPRNDESGAAFGARLCDFVPQAQQAQVQDAIAAADAEAEAGDAAATDWTSLEAGDGTDYGAAVLPGVLIGAIGAFGLAGTVLLSAVVGRRR